MWLNGANAGVLRPEPILLLRLKHCVNQGAPTPSHNVLETSKIYTNFPIINDMKSSIKCKFKKSNLNLHIGALIDLWSHRRPRAMRSWYQTYRIYFKDIYNIYIIYRSLRRAWVPPNAAFDAFPHLH